MTHFCTVTGLKVFFAPEWVNRKVSETFEVNFKIIEDSILYSSPKGFADIEGVKNSLELNKKVVKLVEGGDKPYVQIEDYAFVTGSSIETRKYFSKNRNDDKRLAAMIFCNVTLPFSIAIKLARPFITDKKGLYVVKTYKDAVNLAIEISGQKKLKANPVILDTYRCFNNQSNSLSSVEVLSKDSWNIQTPEYSSRFTVIDQCILHAANFGNLKLEHLPLVERVSYECHHTMPRNKKIEYIVVDGSKFDGIQRSARLKYFDTLKNWHKNYPVKLYILYQANATLKTTFYLAKAFMPFRCKLAKNAAHAFQIIQQDRSKRLSKRALPKSDTMSSVVSSKDIEKLTRLIGSINWKAEAPEAIADTKKDHPFYHLFQSIKLIKEELEQLFNEYQQKEEMLKANDDFLSTIIENIPDMIFLKDAKNLQFVRLNKAAEKFLGYTREELKGKTDYDFFPKEEADIVTKEDREVLKSLRFKDIPQETVQTKYEGVRTLHTKKIPICNEEGTPQYLLGISEDITDHILAEEELKKLSTVVRQGPVSIVITDPEGSIEYVNPRFCKLTGYTAQEAIGKNPSILQSGNTSQETYKQFWETILAGSEWHGELQNKKKNGDLYWENVIISPILNENSEVTHFLGIKEDITERKAAEEKMAASLLEKETLLKEIHHRVKNNMQIISSLLSLQGNKLNDQGTFDALEEATNRIHSMSLVHELLYKSDNLSDINLTAYLEELTKHIASMFIQQDRIRIKINSENITLQMDQAIPIGLIVTELVSNALKYAFYKKNDGVVKIDVRLRNDDQYQMRIADDGLGFPEKLNWETSKTLGLSLVRELVRGQLEGNITLEKDNGICWIIDWRKYHIRKNKDNGIP